MEELHEDMELILNEMPARALIYLRRNKDSYASELSDELGCTYSHIVKMLPKLEEAECIQQQDKEGRKKKISITEKGEKIAEKLQGIDNDLQGLDI